MHEVTAPDVVYVNRPGETNEELRYSLRSLAKNLPHATVWVAGYTPSWVQNVERIPVPKTAVSTKYMSSTANLRAVCGVSGVAERCYLFNDDFFVLQPMPVVPLLNRGLVTDVAQYYLGRGYSGEYVQGMLGTAELLKGLGVDNPVSFELHVPLPFKKSAMKIALDIADRSGLRVPHKRTIYGNLTEEPSETMSDVKVSDSGPLIDALFASTDGVSFASTAGAHIRRLFPEPCRYEVS